MLVNRPKGISINRNALNIQANNNTNLKNQLPAGGPQRTPSPPSLKSGLLQQQQQQQPQPLAQQPLLKPTTYSTTTTTTTTSNNNFDSKPTFNLRKFDDFEKQPQQQHQPIKQSYSEQLAQLELKQLTSLQPLPPAAPQSENDGVVVGPVSRIPSALSRIPRIVIEEEIEDIDKSSGRDAALLVCDVAKDIFNYLFELEEKYQIKPDYLREQKVFTPRVRQRLVNWLIDIYGPAKLNLLQETLYLAIALIDRYFQKVTVKTQSQVQLVAIGATMIASKYEEIWPPEMNDLIILTSNTYTRQDVMRIEIDILEQLDFDLGRPIPLAFLRRFSKAAHGDLKIHSIAKFLMEISLTEYECTHWKPSLIAAAALFVSLHLVNQSADNDKTFNNSTTASTTSFGLNRRLALSSSSANSRSYMPKTTLSSPTVHDRWNRTVAHYSHYTRVQLIEPAATLCRILKRVLNSPDSYNSAQKHSSSLNKWPELKSRRVDELIKLAD